MIEKTSPVHFLVYVEDPGAANMAAPLPKEAARAGLRVCVMAAAGGAAQLARLGVTFDQPRTIDWSGADTPSVLVIGTSENPDSQAFGLIQAARQAGYPTIGLVDGAASSTSRFRGRTKDPLAYAPDWLIVPDGHVAQSYVDLGFGEARVFVGGHPYFDHVREGRARLDNAGRPAVRAEIMPEFSHDERVIVFLAEISDGLQSKEFQCSAEYTLKGRRKTGKRTDIVLEELLDAVDQLDSRPGVVLRLHPKNKIDEFDAYRGEIDLIISDRPALDTVFACDAVIGMTSSLLVEAGLLGLPVVSVTPRRSERMWLGAAADAITSVHERSSLFRVLPEALAGGHRAAAELDGIYPTGAAERIVAFIQEIGAIRHSNGAVA